MSGIVSRGRSRTRSDRGAKRGASRSVSVTSSRSYGGKWGKWGGDGPSKRAYSRRQTYSMVADPFPRMQRAILRYNVCINLNAGFSAERYFFRAGSIFDPDYTGVGTQPYGHDTYQNIYNHYRVLKSVCKITNTTAGQNNVMGLHLADDVAVTGDFNGIKLVKPSVMIPLCTTTEPHSLQMTYDSEAAFPGQSQNCTALFGNNPAEEQYFCVWVTGSNPLADPSAISIMVAIEYLVEMSEIKQLTDS